MTRPIHSHRIAGRATETRRCAPGQATAAALAAAVAVLAIGGVSSLAPTGAVLAQTPGTAGPVSLGDLFTAPDSVDLKRDANAALNAAIANADMRQCRTQKANIKVVMAKGDDLFQQALGTARRDAIDAILKQQGVAAERYAVAYGGIGAKDDVQVEYGDIIPDKDKPKLDTDSEPRKGKKVKANSKIVVTMVATDRANEWQTGIKSIQLQDISTNPNGILVPSPADYGRLPNPCNAATMQQTHVVTYTVPSNPPPIVRLRAIAEDFAGNVDTDIGEFPTGDWYGTFGWTHLCQGGGMRDETRGIGDLTLDYDGRGNLTGRLAGSIPQRSMSYPGCSSFVWLTPGTFSARLVGSYTPTQNTFSAQAVDVKNTWGRASYCGHAAESAFAQIHQSPMFGDAFRDLRRQPDGSLKSDGEHTISVSPQTCTTNYSLTLRPVQN